MKGEKQSGGRDCETDPLMGEEREKEKSRKREKRERAQKGKARAYTVQRRPVQCMNQR
jgi:hypothetical protein